VNIHGGRVEVRLSPKEGEWRLSKINDRTIHIVGRCCGTRYAEDIVGFGNELCECLDRLAYPRELKRGERFVTVKDERSLRLSCNFCHKINSAIIEAELSRSAIQEANRMRRHDVCRVLYGGLIDVSADLSGGRFADVTRPVFLGFICGNCGYRLAEGSIAEAFSGFQHLAESMLSGETDKVETVSKSFSFHCRCGEKLVLRLKISVKQPESRAEWFSVLCRYAPYGSEAFQGRLGSSGRPVYQGLVKEEKERNRYQSSSLRIPDIIQDMDHAVMKDGRLLRRADILAQVNQGKGVVTGKSSE
ncbi:MAG: hypothetical protein V3W09_03600, partial [Nitrososphaerales archaeon]